MAAGNKTANVSTRELWGRLFQSATIDSFLEESRSYDGLPSFSSYITQLCAARGIEPSKVVARTGIDRSFGYRVFAGTRKPSRDTVLQLAFGLELTSDEAQQLLKVARATPLHPKVKRDAVIAYCLHRKKDLLETQLVLSDHGLPLLGHNRDA